MYTTIWIILGAVLFVGYTAAIFGAGGDFRDRHYWPLVPQFAPYGKPDISTPLRFQGVPVFEPTPITGTVIELPQISVVTTSVDVITAPESVREHETLNRELVASYARIAELEGALEASETRSARREHLRQFHLHGKRLATARYAAVVGMTFERKRRTSCEAALATVVDISTARHKETAKVITPLIHQRWVDTELVQAA